MLENETSGKIISLCFNIHSEFGPGLFESVYEEILCYELELAGFSVERQKLIPIVWKDKIMKNGFKADNIVNKKVIVELKSLEQIAPVHKKQLLTYLKLTDLKLGLLINFNESLIKEGITRIANNL